MVDKDAKPLIYNGELGGNHEENSNCSSDYYSYNMWCFI